MTVLITVFAFWSAVLLIGYTFAGYPLLIAALAAIRRRRPVAPPYRRSFSPSVCFVLCAHNEESRIEARLANLFASEYPADRLEALVVSDGSTDGTAARARAARVGRVRVLEEPEQRGKAHGINLAIAATDAEILIFADARQRFTPAAVQVMADAFVDPDVGAVSGSLEIEQATSNAGQGIDLYWKLERRLRRDEATLGSTIGCTGAIYAIRRELYHPIPSDTLLDDVVVPMSILVSGYKVTFEPQAIALDPQSLEPQRERVRKQRTLAGNYQMLFRHPEWLLPWKNRAWWQLISHKYLRLAAPWMLLAALLANAALIGLPFYRALFALQLVLYCFAGLGWALPNLRLRLTSIPAGFVFLNLMAAASLFSYLKDNSQGKWQTTHVAKPSHD
jgi:cellulose synthase/poly-beta-1,6-N-acetylglucosamine synthase-like glycosyltransferase